MPIKEVTLCLFFLTSKLLGLSYVPFSDNIFIVVIVLANSHTASATDASIAQSSSSTLSSGVLDENIVSSRDNQDTYSHATPNPDNRVTQNLVDAAKAKFDLESLPTPSGHVTTSLSLSSENGAGGSSLMLQDGTIGKFLFCIFALFV